MLNEPGIDGVTAEKVRVLKDGSIYGNRADEFQVVETHKSWVFLTPDHAYKMKKPIQYNAVDFRHLETRCQKCRTEVRLIQRLAGDVYEGVSQLVRMTDGRLELDQDGERGECLIRMKRLPQERMLSTSIICGTAHPESIKRVARKLARFYHTTTGTGISFEEYADHLKSSSN